MAAAAGIGAAGSILGGIISGKGAKKAAKIQQQTAREQIAAANANRDYQYNLNAPTIAAGSGATNLISGFLGAGGDANASAQALDSFRGSTGYQDLLKTGLDSVNSNAYAKGAGDSGAALKALQAKGSSIADQSAQGWLGNLGNLASLGGQARSLVAGVGQNTVSSNNASSQSAADASSNATLFNASNWSKIVTQLGAIGAGAMGGGAGATGSSFGGAGSWLPGAPTSVPVSQFNPGLPTWR